MPAAVDRVRALLADAVFPATRDDLVRHAETRGPGDDDLHTLLVLPEGRYDDLDTVVATVAADPEREQRAPGPGSGAHDIVADDD